MDAGPAERAIARIVSSAFSLTEESARSAGDGADLDWPALAGAAERSRVAPLLFAALRAQGRLGQGRLGDPPAEVVQRLRVTCLATGKTNALAYRELGRLLDLFGRERIPVVLLKGAALAATLYPNMALRPMCDLDLLIPRDAAPAATALLLGEGYSSPEDVADGFQERFGNERGFRPETRATPQIELHWHLFNFPHYSERIPIEWFWERTQEIRLEERLARVLAPEAEILHLAGHFVLHHQARGLLWSYDLALLVARLGGRMDWEEVARSARAFGLGQALETALAEVRDSWGVAVPEKARASLRSYRPTIGDRLSLAIATAPGLDTHTVWDGLSLAGWRAKLGFLLRKCFPSAAFMRDRYGVRDPRLLPFHYVWRLAKGTGKLAITVPAIVARAVEIFARRPRTEDKREG